MEADVVGECLTRNDMDFLYEDLEGDIYNRRDEEIEAKLNKLTEEVNFYKNKYAETQNLIEEREKTITDLKRNISSLYLTSKQELDRKTERIKVLSEQLDQYILSEMRSSKRPWREEERHFSKRFKRDNSRDSYRTGRPPEVKIEKHKEYHRDTDKRSYQNVNDNSNRTRHKREYISKSDDKCTKTVTLDLRNKSTLNDAITNETRTKQVQGGSTDSRKQIELQKAKSIQKVGKRDISIISREKSKSKDTFIHKVEEIQNGKINTKTTTPELVGENKTSSRKGSKPNDTYSHKNEPIHSNAINIETMTTEQVREDSTNSRKKSKPNHTFNCKIEKIQNGENKIDITAELIQDGSTISRKPCKPNNAAAHKVEPLHNDRINIEMTTGQIGGSVTNSMKQSKPNDTFNHKIEENQNGETMIETATTEQIQEGTTSSINEGKPNGTVVHKIDTVQNRGVNTEPMATEQVEEDSTNPRKQSQPNGTSHQVEEIQNDEIVIETTADPVRESSTSSRNQNKPKDTSLQKIDAIQNDGNNIETAITEQVREDSTNPREPSKPSDTFNYKIGENLNDETNTETTSEQVQGGSTSSRDRNKPNDTTDHIIETVQNLRINIKLMTTTEQVQENITDSRKQSQPNGTFHQIEEIQNDEIVINTTELVREGGTSPRIENKPNDAFIQKIEEVQNDGDNIETARVIEEVGTNSGKQNKPSDGFNHIIKEIQNHETSIETTTTKGAREDNASSRKQSTANDASIHKVESVQINEISIETTTITEQVREYSKRASYTDSCGIESRENNKTEVKTTIKQTQEDSTKCRKKNKSNGTYNYKIESVQINTIIATEAITMTQDQGEGFSSKEDSERDHNYNKNNGGDKTAMKGQNNHRVESQRSMEVDNKETVGKEVSDQSKGEISDVVRPEKNPVWRIPKIVRNGDKQICLYERSNQNEKLVRKENKIDYNQDNTTLKEGREHAIHRNDKVLNSRKIERKTDKSTKVNTKKANNRSTKSERSKKKCYKETTKGVSDTEHQVSDCMVKSQKRLVCVAQKIENDRIESERINKVERSIWKGDATDYKQVQQIIREGITNSQKVEDHITTPFEDEETARKGDMVDSNRNNDTELDKIDKTSRLLACGTQMIEDSEGKKKLEKDDSFQKEPKIKEDTMGCDQSQGSQLSTVISVKTDNSPNMIINKTTEPNSNRTQSEEPNNKETTRKYLSDRSQVTERQDSDSSAKTQKVSDCRRQRNESETPEQSSKKVEYEKPNQRGEKAFSQRSSREGSERSERSQRGSDQERHNHNCYDRRKCKDDELRKHKESGPHKRYEEDYRKRFEEVQKRYLESDRNRSEYDRKRYGEVENDRKRYEEYHRRRRVENDRKKYENVERCETVDPRKCRGYDVNRFDGCRRFKENDLKKCLDDRKRRESDPGRYEEDRRWFRPEREDYVRTNHDSHTSRGYRTVFEEGGTRRLVDDRHKSDLKSGRCKESDTNRRDDGGSPKAPLSENRVETRSGLNTSALLSLPEDHLEELLKSRQEKLKKLEEMEKQLSLPNLTEDDTLLDSCADQWETNAVDEWIPVSKEEKPPEVVLNSDETVEKKCEDPIANADLQKCKNNERSTDVKQKPNFIETGLIQETPNGKIDKIKLISDLLKTESKKLTRKKSTRGYKPRIKSENAKTPPESNSTNDFKKISDASNDDKCRNIAGKKRSAPAGSPCKSKKKKVENIAVPICSNEEQENVNNAVTNEDFKRNNIEPKLDMTRSTKEMKIEPDVEINKIKDTEHVQAMCEKENSTEKCTFENTPADSTSKSASSHNGGIILRIPKMVIKLADKTEIITVENTIDSPVINEHKSQNSNGPCPNKNVSTVQSSNINLTNAISSNSEMVTDVLNVEKELITVTNKGNNIIEGKKINTKNNKQRKGSFDESVGEIIQTKAPNVIENAKKETPPKPVENPKTNNRRKSKASAKPSRKVKTRQSKRNTSTGKNDGIESSNVPLSQQSEPLVRKSPRLLERQQTLGLPTKPPNLGTPTYKNTRTVKSPNSVKNMVYSIFGSMDSILDEIEKEKEQEKIDSSATPANTPSVIILSDIKLRDANTHSMDQIKPETQDRCIERKGTIENGVFVESNNTSKNVSRGKSTKEVVTASPTKKSAGSTETNKSPRKRVTFDTKAETATPTTQVPRRRITPIRLSSSPAVSKMCCSDATGLRLTYNGEIPLLNLEETTFSGLSAEGIQENSIMHLLHTMNVSNLGNESIKFQSNLTNDLNTSVDSATDFTFGNFIDKITSTPIPSESYQEETEGRRLQLSTSSATPSTGRTEFRHKRRRCKLILME